MLNDLWYINNCRLPQQRKAAGLCDEHIRKEVPLIPFEKEDSFVRF
jgi:hypothetical protein